MSELTLCERVVAFINSSLLPADCAPATADTPLFEHGVLDSMRVLDLLAFVEAETGRALPDSSIRLANFRTAATIAATAATPAGPARASRDRIWSRNRSRRAPVAPDAVLGLEEELDRWAREIGATAVHYGRAIPTAALSRAGYLESFPGRAIALAGTANGDDLSVPPAACLHCYAHLADQTLESTPLAFDVVNHCARGDERVDAAQGRLREFTMREIVVVGTATEVERRRRALMRRAQTYLTRLDVAATIEVASDPFHISADRGKLALQRLRALKYELRMPVGGETIAVASFNYHEDYFGRAFSISLPDGMPAHSACIAFGLERWELALRAQLDGSVADLARTA